MMRSLLLLAAVLAAAAAFAPGASVVSKTASSSSPAPFRTGPLYIDMGEPERKALTRDTEPDEFFSTNTDKMTDQEKLPIAIAGLVGISLPFILGLIALYAAK
mmetsp:Transcript_35326/g.75407  ORF Transcript_35326/g.75407 Transcript_35326/m.75407 type:complete len:103 (-) Transcript_35326:349-657(-)|eukprot:CAMPEP_0172525766 /NCGR_PEP_ID=MMETSP1067-20121228/777_1 /TAXON_ID=265564 ORGANISM="Thalassiosira punctigera, Strain Tpunct2005C2" /NCGR_SAMPLE_ID=MMETSP1067 /ASSEMBLY_ACC=CAM_ASM_000444 /LENGTH=102 /DNA_ID=CAMNT_0013309109 /DNA_START=84 /DNA_END=392 /DNA_ORIENTATION=+